VRVGPCPAERSDPAERSTANLHNPGVNDLGALDAVARQTRLALEASRRPWPLPEGPWSQAQTRRDVLLAHWRVEFDELARLLPPELALDTFAGEAWLGISACRVESLRARGLPPLPGLSSSPQLEVFTYVAADDRPGLWYVSLELTKQLLVEAAKRAHRLPAYRATIAAEAGSFEARRGGLGFRARWEAAGEPFEPAPGSLDHFLTERYALYTADGGRLYRAELQHAPWLLQSARATVETATLAPVPLEGAPHALASAVQDLLLWPLEEL
jgi:uncharacterized protein YqjF (DUF2071 family)